MADLVKNIQTWALNQSDTKLLETVKEQLKDKKTDVNKLSKNLRGDSEITPLHAALDSNCTELFKLVLETEGVDTDPEFSHKGKLVGVNFGGPSEFGMQGSDREFEVKGGILDYAVRSGNLEMINIVLDRIEIKHWSAVMFDNQAIPGCIFTAVSFDRLDILALLLTYQKKYCQLSHVDCMILAIMLNKAKVFSKVLPKALALVNVPFGEYKDTLLHKAVQHNRVKMLRLLVEAGSDVNAKNVDGFTPLTLAVSIAGSNYCGEGCLDVIISELLDSKCVDLDVTVNQGTAVLKAIDFLTEKTCGHVRKLVEQAYSRDIYRKKLEKRKEQKAQAVPSVPSKEEVKVGTKSKEPASRTKVKDENKICWSCSADPDKVVLFRCRGCKKAWYCGEQCQEEDWPVHGPWCERKRNKREEKLRAKEEEERKMSSTFYDLD